MDMAQLSRAAEYINERICGDPEIALILGTGLGGFAAQLQNAVVIPYGDIPGFPVSTAPYHKGQLIAGYLGDKYVLILQGRIHYYEG